VTRRSADLLIRMLRKLEYICLVGSIALIGADRIDLLAGKGTFTLTPFVVLAPLLFSLSALNNGMAGRFTFATTPAIQRMMPYFSWLIVFLFLSSIATIFGIDPERGVMALIDLFLVSLLSLFIAVRILSDPEPDKLILTSITTGLVVYFVFCIGECVAWSHGIIQGAEGGSWLESMFAAKTLFWMPRVSGSTVDANRSGFVLVMYLALLDHFVPKSRYTKFLRFAIAIFILLAISRSAILCWIAYLLFSKSSWIRRTSWQKIAWASGLAMVCLLAAIYYRTEIGTLFDAWQVTDIISDRMSGEEGTSGGDHIRLIQLGFDTWTSTPHTVIAGTGLRSAPRVLGNFFGDDKNGNFHCLYVTALAELGLPAFLVLMVLFLYPLAARKGALPSIAAIMIFNAPYQSHMEPIFWLVLALAWSYGVRKMSQLRSALPVRVVAV
jgi:hypothetical protein